MSQDLNYKIKEIRKLRKYSQSVIADKLKVSQRAYSKIELGQTKLSWNYLNQIAAILEVNIWDIIDTTKDDDGKHTSNINLTVALINQYENEIDCLKKEVTILNDKINYLQKNI